jgi:hypothetical protein
MLKKINTMIEGFLYRRGFKLHDVRRIVGNQLVYSTVSTLVALLATGFGTWGIAYAAGALLISFNFYLVAKAAQEAVWSQGGGVTALLFWFYLRLGASGIILYGLIVWARMPIAALLAGLSTVLITALYWGVTRFAGQKVKEA